MTHEIYRADAVFGTLEIPSDKSIAHRAALLAAITDGVSRLVHYPDSQDPQSTLSCLRALGVEIVDEDGILVVHGRGRYGLAHVDPSKPVIDCDNSGTTMRLLAGILAGQAYTSTLVGDASLSRRPMDRIATPLRLMGAGVELRDGAPPIDITGGKLRPIEYPLPVRSAQVKSCVLLAGLFADGGETTVVESAPTRDHTERMLGVPVVDIGDKRYVSIRSDHSLVPQTYTIPRDFSSAAFFIVAAALAPEALLRLPGVGVNPSRAALLDLLIAMGANITISNSRLRSGEPIADIDIRHSQLTGVAVGGEIVPNLIDEIPILAVAATQAIGTTIIRDAAELRVKESDRIAAMAEGLSRLGADVAELKDGLRIEGPTPLQGAEVDAKGDHRVAMALGIAGLVASGVTTVRGSESAAVSYPGFWSDLESVSFSQEAQSAKK